MDGGTMKGSIGVWCGEVIGELRYPRGCVREVIRV